MIGTLPGQQNIWAASFLSKQSILRRLCLQFLCRFTRAAMAMRSNVTKGSWFSFFQGRVDQYHLYVMRLRNVSLEKSISILSLTQPRNWIGFHRWKHNQSKLSRHSVQIHSLPGYSAESSQWFLHDVPSVIAALKTDMKCGIPGTHLRKRNQHRVSAIKPALSWGSAGWHATPVRLKENWHWDSPTWWQDETQRETRG